MRARVSTNIEASKAIIFPVLPLSFGEMASSVPNAFAQVGLRRILLRHHNRESDTYNKCGSNSYYDH